MRVLLDIPVLGLGHARNELRGGTFRVHEYLAEGLARSGECELLLCANLLQLRVRRVRGVPAGQRGAGRPSPPGTSGEAGEPAGPPSAGGFTRERCNRETLAASRRAVDRKGPPA